MNITDRLTALAAAPKPWEYVISYDSGKVLSFGALSEAAAKTGASVHTSKIGKSLICRETGETVVVTSVEVRRREPACVTG